MTLSSAQLCFARAQSISSWGMLAQIYANCIPLEKKKTSWTSLISVFNVYLSRVRLPLQLLAMAPLRHFEKSFLNTNPKRSRNMISSSCLFQAELVPQDQQQAEMSANISSHRPRSVRGKIFQFHVMQYRCKVLLHTHANHQNVSKKFTKYADRCNVSPAHS